MVDAGWIKSICEEFKPVCCGYIAWGVGGCDAGPGISYESSVPNTSTCYIYWSATDEVFRDFELDLRHGIIIIQCIIYLSIGKMRILRCRNGGFGVKFWKNTGVLGKVKKIWRFFLDGLMMWCWSGMFEGDGLAIKRVGYALIPFWSIDKNFRVGRFLEDFDKKVL